MPGADRTGRRGPRAGRAPALHDVSPRAAALAILDVAAQPETPAGPARPEPVPLPRADGLIGFQAEAVDRAEAILARRGGVLIADGVGMGKTRMGAALAIAAARQGRRVLLVVPAGLRRHWRTELRAQGGAAAAACVVTSHTRLSRQEDPEEGGGPFGRIVVDEAHAFRNPRTRRYAALARLARAAEVVLLSATPINNSLLDLYFLIRLFAGDGAFADVGVPDLALLFRLAALAPDGPPPPALAAALGTVLIRRTRGAAVGLAGRGLRFPERAAPAVVRYDLTGVYRDAFDDAVAAIEALRLAPYRLAAYGVGTGGGPAGHRPGASGRAGAAELLRLLLAKRLESGVAAFLGSVRQLSEQLTAFRDALDRGLLRRPSDRPRGRSASPDQLVFEELLLARLPPGLDACRLRADTDADLTLLRRLSALLAGAERPGPSRGDSASAMTPDVELGAGARSDLRTAGGQARSIRSGSPGAAARSDGVVFEAVPARAAGSGADPKVESLRRLLFDELRTDKALVFTEFRDTAVHLWRALRDAGGVALIHGSQAFLGAAQAGRAEVVRRFAPRANGVREPPAREAVRVLIATDVLAEGLNLQDAAHVISFDLPWNPVRLIQRIGRVDRLGSLHATVHAHHFLPDAGLERLLGLVERLRRKLAAIRSGLGGRPGGWPAGDAADPDTRGIVERLAAGDPTLLDALEAADAGAYAPTDSIERLRAELAAVEELACLTGASAGARAQGDRIARRAPSGRAQRESTGTGSAAVRAAAVRRPGVAVSVVAVRGEEGPLVVEIGADGRVAAVGAAGLDLLRDALSDQRCATLTVGERRAAWAAVRLACTGAARGTTFRRAPGGSLRSAAGRAIHTLRAAVAALPDAPDTALCARVDRLTSVLAPGLRAGQDAALRELLDRWQSDASTNPDALCDRLERFFGLLVPAVRSAADPPGVPIFEPVAVLVRAHEVAS